MKTLVTGAGGFVGGAITRALLDAGREVRSFSRGAYPALEALGVETVRGDVANAKAVSDAVRGCDSVFHVAARVDFWGSYEDFFHANTLGTQNVIDASREHGVGRLVYTSTPSVVGGGGDVSGVDESAPYPARYLAHYPATKALAEQAVLAANDDTLRTCALRPHLVWGPGDTSALPRLVARARAGRVRLVGDPRFIDTCYIDNCVDAQLAAEACLADPDSACAGRAYFITQDEPITGPQFMNDMLAAAGLPPITRRVSTPVAKLAAAVLETVYSTLRLEREPPLTRFLVSTLSTDHFYDISAARRDLGYAPRVSYAEGMERLRAWIDEAHPFG